MPHNHLTTRHLEDLCLLGTYSSRDDPSLKENVPDLYRRLCKYGSSKEEIYHQARYRVSICEQCSLSYFSKIVKRKSTLNFLRRRMKMDEINNFYSLDALKVLN